MTEMDNTTTSPTGVAHKGNNISDDTMIMDHNDQATDVSSVTLGRSPSPELLDNTQYTSTQESLEEIRQMMATDAEKTPYEDRPTMVIGFAWDDPDTRSQFPVMNLPTYHHLITWANSNFKNYSGEEVEDMRLLKVENDLASKLITADNWSRIRLQTSCYEGELPLIMIGVQMDADGDAMEMDTGDEDSQSENMSSLGDDDPISEFDFEIKTDWQNVSNISLSFTDEKVKVIDGVVYQQARDDWQTVVEDYILPTARTGQRHVRFDKSPPK